ncbi:MAG: SDR family NAD(P)-dependent oxidoreductase [Acidobacteria bacterium]|nr:SDR family NAD(P)-dependent oxidoreductase [Acidobacteriota bacterium]
MSSRISGKVIVVTGAGSGFGRLICQRGAAAGAKIVAADINAAALRETVDAITASGGAASALVTDVTDLAAMRALAAHAVATFGAIDVMINNAGIMPLAFYADHARADAAWDRCIDINIKGVLHGILAVHDQMIAQGRGHIINISSIYGNFPVAGAGVYGATKAAVNFLSEALRVESQGKIKVTIIKPTGVPATGLGAAVINPAAIVGILGQNAATYLPAMQSVLAGTAPAAGLDPENAAYLALDPGFIADQVLHAIDQPWGVSLGDVTVRATGDGYIL